MANMTISVNESVKRAFTQFCDDVGLTGTAGRRHFGGERR